jgi:predicted transposase YbfD/YdcC
MEEKLNLQKHFSKIKDFRVEGRCEHLLSDILVLVLCGVIADCDDFGQVYDYGKFNEQFLKEELGLSLKNGIPSEDTLGRVMRLLKPEGLQTALQDCYRDIGIKLAGKHLSIDGKELRGTIPKGKKHALIQLVSVWVSEEKLSFGQLAVDAKSNEITAIPALIEMLDCSGSTITIDAMGCQKDITEKIISQEADYIIGLKKNQGALYEQVSQWLLKQKPMLPCYQEINKDHGRGEVRKVYVCQNLSLLEATEQWAGLRSVVMVESIRLVSGKEETSTRFYISSLLNKEPKVYADYIRKHWEIENKLHWQLDISFNEDASRVRKDNGPQNLSAIRKIALFLLGKDNNKISMKRKRKKASRNNQYLLELLKNA